MQSPPASARKRPASRPSCPQSLIAPSRRSAEVKPDGRRVPAGCSVPRLEWPAGARPALATRRWSSTARRCSSIRSEFVLWQHLLRWAPALSGSRAMILFQNHYPQHSAGAPSSSLSGAVPKAVLRWIRCLGWTASLSRSSPSDARPCGEVPRPIAVIARLVFLAREPPILVGVRCLQRGSSTVTLPRPRVALLLYVLEDTRIAAGRFLALRDDLVLIAQATSLPSGSRIGGPPA